MVISVLELPKKGIFLYKYFLYKIYYNNKTYTNINRLYILDKIP